MCRVAALSHSINTLRLPYTYDLITVPQVKRNARKQIGGMAVEIVETMRNELMHAACVRYLQARGLTYRQIDVIFRGDDGTREISIEHFIDRPEECEGTSTETIERVIDSEHCISRGNKPHGVQCSAQNIEESREKAREAREQLENAETSIETIKKF